MSIELLSARPADAMVPWGLAVEDAYAEFMRSVFPSDRRWLFHKESRVALPAWELDGRLYVGGKSHLLVTAETPVAWLAAMGRPWQAAFAATQSPCDGARRATDVFLVPLSPDQEARRRALDKKWRNQLGKAERHGGEFRPFRDEEFDSWFSHFRSCISGMGVRTRAPEYYRAFIQAMGDRLLWCGLWSDGRLLASGMGFVGGGRASLLWQSSDPLGREWCANNLFYWNLLQWLAERGVTFFDLGPTSTEDASGAHFKLGLGAERRPIWRYGDGTSTFFQRLRGWLKR